MKKCVGSFGNKACNWCLCKDYNKCILKYWKNKLDKKNERLPKQIINEMIKYRQSILDKSK